jgi:hypothetical protein
MPALGENVAGQQDIGAGDFARIDALAERQRVGRIRAKVPDRGKTPLCQHLLHVLRERRRGSVGRTAPDSLREMNVAVPEAGDNGLAGAIDYVCAFGDLDIACTAYGLDSAIGNDNDCIRQRSGIGRADERAALQGQRLGARRDTGGNSHTEKADEKRGTKPIADHFRHLIRYAGCSTNG